MARKSAKKPKSYTEFDVYKRLGAFKMEVETFFEATERKIAKRGLLTHEDAEDMVVALDLFEQEMENYNKLVTIFSNGEDNEY